MRVSQEQNHGTYRATMCGFLLRGLGAGALALALGAAALPVAAHQNNSQYAPQDQQQGAGDQGQYRGHDQGQYSTNQGVPSNLTLPAGTVVPVRVDEWLSSDKNQPGDRFSATLDQPLIANGWVVARRGQVITGRVELAQKAGHGIPASRLGLALGELTLVDGQVLPVNTQLVPAGYRPNANNTGRDVAVVGTTTVLGAIIGGVASGGTGAAIGAGVGAAGGAIGIMSTHGGPTVVQPETLLTFRLESPLTVSTQQSQIAFQPVGQGDYNASSNRDQDAYGGGPRPRVVAPPPPPYPYYYYGFPYGWGYPGPGYLGFYGGFYGPRVVIRGGGFRGGFHGHR